MQSERDKLLAEKESWSKTPAPTGESVVFASAPGDWEAEKAQLTKARDEALERLKVGLDAGFQSLELTIFFQSASIDIQKAQNEYKSVKFQNVSPVLLNDTLAILNLNIRTNSRRGFRI